MKIDELEIGIEPYKTTEYLSDCFGVIDLTSLNATDTNVKIEEICKKIIEFPDSFPELPNVAALCVYPSFTSLVKKKLNTLGVKIAVTGAGFPASQTYQKIKVEECRMAAEEGADEVDIVMSLNHFLSGDYAKTYDEISAIKEAIGRVQLKVIIESGTLSECESISLASRIVMEAGADFIKTSTGKSDPAATPEAAVVMCREIKAFWKKTGKRIGFKPAGGIATPNDALIYYAIVHNLLGADWLSPSLFRIGASRLANNLLSEIKGKPIYYF